MQPELKSMFDRANELLSELEKEYTNCLKTETVSERAKNLTHEMLEKLRSILDHTMRITWNKYIEPKLSEKDKTRAMIYFPIVDSPNDFRSTLGRGCMVDLDKINKNIYDFLLKQQPFSSNENKWLKLLTEIAAEGKHVRLTPQKRTETRRIKVTSTNGSVSWDPDTVKYGRGVSVMGAPINPETQRIIPTQDITETIEIWVSFILEGYEVNALGFCKEASQKTRVLIEEMLKIV